VVSSSGTTTMTTSGNTSAYNTGTYNTGTTSSMNTSAAYNNTTSDSAIKTGKDGTTTFVFSKNGNFECPYTCIYTYMGW